MVDNSCPRQKHQQAQSCSSMTSSLVLLPVQNQAHLGNQREAGRPMAFTIKKMFFKLSHCIKILGEILVQALSSQNTYFCDEERRPDLFHLEKAGLNFHEQTAFPLYFSLPAEKIQCLSLKKQYFYPLGLAGAK